MGLFSVASRDRKDKEYKPLSEDFESVQSGSLKSRDSSRQTKEVSDSTKLAGIANGPTKVRTRRPAKFAALRVVVDSDTEPPTSDSDTSVEQHKEKTRKESKKENHRANVVTDGEKTDSEKSSKGKSKNKVKKTRKMKTYVSESDEGATDRGAHERKRRSKESTEYKRKSRDATTQHKRSVDVESSSDEEMTKRCSNVEIENNWASVQIDGKHAMAKKNRSSKKNVETSESEASQNQIRAGGPESRSSRRRKKGMRGASSSAKKRTKKSGAHALPPPAPIGAPPRTTSFNSDVAVTAVNPFANKMESKLGSDMTIVAEAIGLDLNTQMMLAYYDARSLEDFGYMAEADVGDMLEKAKGMNKQLPPLQIRKIEVLRDWVKNLIETKDDNSKVPIWATKPETKKTKSSIIPKDWKARFKHDLPELKQKLRAKATEEENQPAFFSYMMTLRSAFLCGI